MTPDEIAEVRERHEEGYPLVEYLIPADIAALLAHIKEQDFEYERLKEGARALLREIDRLRRRLTYDIGGEEEP